MPGSISIAPCPTSIPPPPPLPPPDHKLLSPKKAARRYGTPTSALYSPTTPRHRGTCCRVQHPFSWFTGAAYLGSSRVRNLWAVSLHVLGDSGVEYLAEALEGLWHVFFCSSLDPKPTFGCWVHFESCAQQMNLVFFWGGPSGH